MNNSNDLPLQRILKGLIRSPPKVSCTHQRMKCMEWGYPLSLKVVGVQDRFSVLKCSYYYN